MATKEEAQQAVFDAVEVLAKQAAQYGGPTGAIILRDSALAYRYAAGGQQPGAVTTLGK